MSATGDHKTWHIVILAMLLTTIFPSQPAMALLSACSVNTSYSSGDKFAEDDFSLVNVGVDKDGYFYLKAGKEVIDPENIVIPVDQEVFVSFFYEAGDFKSTLGWLKKADVVDSAEKFVGWDKVVSDKKQHPIFRRISDGTGGGDGIIDAVANLTEGQLAAYVDGTGAKFAVDNDGSVTPRDMRKSLGFFKANDELVFFLGANQDYNSTASGKFFFTKQTWNPDTYTICVPPAGDTTYWINETAGTFKRFYELDKPRASTAVACTMTKGFLADTALNRLKNKFNLTLSGTAKIEITKKAKFPHVLAAIPAEDNNQWILGWEDVPGGGDADFNDIAFRIELKSDGTTTADTALTPAEAGSYYTAVTFQVYDYMPGGDLCAGQTNIAYDLSIDNGREGSWFTIKNWDIIKSFTVDGAEKKLGDTVSNWSPGKPEYTYRSVRVDFAGMNMSGRQLLWRAILSSDKPDACIPKILSTSVEGSVATHGFYSRSSPVMAANVLYSGSYETPDSTWKELALRGHAQATRLYDPSNLSTTSTPDIWDAGTVLGNATPPDNRTIYFPKATITPIAKEPLGKGDGVTKTFTGTLKNAPILPTTLTITCDNKSFKDEYINELRSLWGSGAINRVNGEYSISFNTAPVKEMPILASYTTYETTKGEMEKFVVSNTSNLLLGLDDTSVATSGYTYDFDGNGKYNSDDGQWLTEWLRGYTDGALKKKEKEWKLGPIDHSTPALLTPPGTPSWYYGADITDTEREDYKKFKDTYKERRTLLFVGALDGMLHAFDAGAFRWGDNPKTTDITEQRGYFEWQDLDNNNATPLAPNYGTGKELWAFIPANLLSKLKNNRLSGEDQAYVDASPTLANVYVKGAWRTVLLAAEGNGGDSVFCLDVTNPTTPTLLWEFADPDLFRSRSSPAVGKIGRLMDKGEVRWAAFFVSGKNYDTNEYPSIYIIDIADGKLIERVYLNDEVSENEVPENATRPSGLGGVPSGQPAIIDSDSNGYIDRLYVGTDKGLMYKVNLSDDPEKELYAINDCIINTDFEATDKKSTIANDQRWHPIYASPTVVIDNGITANGKIDYNIRVFFGTGDSPYYDEDINTSTRYHFFAYNDQNDKNECFGNSGSNSVDDAVELNWFYTLDEGEKIFASAFAAAGQIYFGTATSETEDPCESPTETRDKGSLYVFNTTYASNPANPITKFATGDVTTTPLVEDEHLFIKSSSGLTIIGDAYNNMPKATGMGQAQPISWREISH